MAKLIAQRLLGVVGILFAMSVLVFCIVHILPGNVAYAILIPIFGPLSGAHFESGPCISCLSCHCCKHR
jgi:peptide/nickel transport system permease protein